jgi:RNA polymerase sigma-70 factor, ECF subfamily
MDQDTPTDEEFVAESLAGNREKFGQLYDRYARTVRAVVAAVSGDWSAVEDMTQESFLCAYRNLSKLRDPDRFGRWIVGIAWQVARERRRSLRRDRHELRPVSSELEPTATLDANVEDRDQTDRVIQRLALLPEQERLAIHAFFLQQQDANQAAEVVGLSRSGFYVLIQRALARLAKRIEPGKPVASTKK